MKKLQSPKEVLLENPRDSSLNLSKAMPAVYDELRRLARRYMAREKAGLQTLQATALVNEAYLRLIREKSRPWKNRAHFCAIAARSMREILIERARARTAFKRGGSRVRVSLEGDLESPATRSFDLLVLDDALERLSSLDPQLGRIVELRFFGGLTVEETAESLGVSPVTVKRGWSIAKAWLRNEMENRHES
jgi:RNA polymerase sigma factor (TIGR02999 family)